MQGFPVQQSSTARHAAARQAASYNSAGLLRFAADSCKCPVCFQQIDSANWYDENVPTSEGTRPRGEGDIVEGSIGIEVTFVCCLACMVKARLRCMCACPAH